MTLCAVVVYRNVNYAGGLL